MKRRELIEIFTTTGIIMGTTNVYTYYYVYKSFGFDNVFYMVTAANIIAILLSLLYFKYEHDVKDTILYSILILTVTDALLLASMKLHNLYIAGTAITLLSTAWLTLWNSNEYYLMKLEGLQNRAKIVSNRLFIQNIVSSITAYIFGKILFAPVLTITTSIIVKSILVTLLYFTLPPAPTDENDAIHFEWVSTRTLLAAIPFFITLFSSMLFITTRSLFIGDKIGPDFIGTIVSLTYVMQIAASRTVTPLLTRRGKILTRTGVLLLALAIGFYYSTNTIIAAVTTIFAGALFTIITLSQRHLVFKQTKPSNTRSIIAFGRYSAAIARSMLSIALYTGATDPIHLFSFLPYFLLFSVTVSLIFHPIIEKPNDEHR